jgi:hypothetical protein
MFQATASAYRASLSETLASRGSGNNAGGGGGNGAAPPPPNARRPLSTQQQQALLRQQRRRHTLSGGGRGNGRSNNNNSSTLLALLAEACQSTTCLTGLLLLGAAIVAFSLRGLYGAPAPLPGRGGVGVKEALNDANLPVGSKQPLSLTAEQPLPNLEPHAPALPPGTAGGEAERRRQTGQEEDAAPGSEGGAPAPPPVPLDDALYAEAYVAAFPILPLSDDDDGGENGGARAKTTSRPRPHRHLQQRRLARARLAEGLPPAGLAMDADNAITVNPTAPPLLSASVAVRAITGRPRHSDNNKNDNNALPPTSAVAVATFVSTEAQLEFALNWAAGLDAAGVDGDGEEDPSAAAAATGYLAVAATPELAARLADAGVPSAVFPTPDQARSARAEWEAAAAAAIVKRNSASEEEAEEQRVIIADVPTPLVAAEAAARGHPRVALARALLEFGFSSALVTDPDVAWAVDQQQQQQQQQQLQDPRVYLAEAARQANADALVGSNTLSPGAGRAGLVDPGLDVPTALILGSSGVAELVQGGGGGGGGAFASSPFPPPPRGLNRNQTNAAASAAFGASRRLTDGLLDPGFMFLRRTPATMAFADAWCSVMAGKGEGGGSGADGTAAQSPPPPVDSHAFNRLALDGWDPRFVPAPGTWSALHVNGATYEEEQQPAPPAALVASPSVPPPARALVGWRGRLRLGVLPLASFPNGHAHFVQRVHDMAMKVAAVNATMTKATTPQPLFAVRPSTHLFGGGAGKRHRLRDAGLWRLDGPEYFFGWDSHDLLAADDLAREEATLRREKRALEREAEQKNARDAAAARASALAVAAGAGKGMGAGELAAKFFRPFSAGAASSPAWASVMMKKGAVDKGGEGGDKAPSGGSNASTEKHRQRRYVAFALPLAPDLPSAEFEALPGGAEEMSHYHAAGLALQREQLMAMVGVALALGRALVLPRFTCYCDRHWTMLHRCRVPGGGLTPLPFTCPQDHVAEPGKFGESGLLGEATPLDVREASFLTRSRPPGSMGPRVLEVEPTEGVDGPREVWGRWVGDECREEEEGVETRPQPQPQQRCLKRLILPLDTAQGVLRAHLRPYENEYDVLRFSTPLRVLRSFDSPEAAAAAARRIAHLRGSDAGAGLPSSATSSAAAAARRRRRTRAAIAAATAKAKEEEEALRRRAGGGGEEAEEAKAPSTAVRP